MVAVLCSYTRDQPLSVSTLSFMQSSLTSDQLQAIAQDQKQLGYNMALFIANNNVTNEAGLDAFINYSCGQDATLANITPIIIDGLNQAPNEATALNLLASYENYFINTQTNISAQDQYALLNGLAIGRYSVTMWADAYSVH